MCVQLAILYPIFKVQIIKKCHVLASSTASLMPLTPSLMRWLIGVAWFPLFLFSPRGHDTFASRQMILRRRYVLAMAVVMQV